MHMLNRSYKNLKAIPLELKEANAFVGQLHRHHVTVHRDKFRVGCMVDGKLVGVAQVGRPVSLCLDDGMTLEVVRLCSDGTPNVCSFLYSRCARIAKEMGYKKIVTYILDSEKGTSLKASGWHMDKITTGGKWDTPSRHRNVLEEDLFGNKEKYPTCNKQRWCFDIEEELQG